MILGFAHLMVNTGDIALAEAEWGGHGYQRTAYHRKAPNHPSKAAFTDSYHSDHDLMLLAGEGLWPLELTFHGPVSCENRQISWHREQLEIACPEPGRMQSFLEDGLGFRPQDGGTLNLESRLPGWGCRIQLREGDAPPPRTDGAGATGLAFYVRRIAEEMEKMKELGATAVSGVFELTLAERAMKIVLMRAPGGPLIELIELDAKALRS